MHISTANKTNYTIQKKMKPWVRPIQIFIAWNITNKFFFLMGKLCPEKLLIHSKSMENVNPPTIV